MISLIEWRAVGRQSVGNASAFAVVDENYEACSLWGELCATCHEEEAGFRLERVCTKTTVTFARAAEDAILLGV